MNKVILIGNIVKEVELKKTTSGKSVCSFPIAVNKTVNGEKVADYFDIVCWEKLAETVSKYMTKGSKIAVEGELTTRTYEKQDGSKVKVVEVFARNIDFLNSKEQDHKHANIEEDKPSKTVIEVEDEELPFY